MEIPETGDELLDAIREMGPGPSANALVFLFETMNPEGEAMLDQLLDEGRIKREQTGREPLRWIVTE